jgi:hypothetical protein
MYRAGGDYLRAAKYSTSAVFLGEPCASGMLCAPNMPKVVLDSSVLVSAFLTPRGTVVRLLREPARSRYQLCLSEYILTETAETLLSKPRLRTGTYPTPILPCGITSALC